MNEHNCRCPGCGECSAHASARNKIKLMSFIVHVAGPDDVMRFNDELVAHRHANEINKTYLADRLKNPNSEVLCVATVRREA